MHKKKRSIQLTEESFYQLRKQFRRRVLSQMSFRKVDSAPKFVNLSNRGDIKTRDSSEHFNIFADHYRKLEITHSVSSQKTDKKKHIVVAVPSINYDTLNENSEPMEWLFLARSLFEKRLKREERELLKNPKSVKMLNIFGNTILSPIATLLMKFHAPSSWSCCKKCGGFIETHCCIRSNWQSEFEEANETNAFKYRLVKH